MAPQMGSASLGGPWGPRAGALSGAVVVGTGRRGRRRVHVGCCGRGGGGGGRVHRRVVVVMRVRVRVRVRVVAVATQAWQRVGRRPALGPEVVVVGGGRVLVGMVVQRLGRARRLQAQIGVRGTVAPSGSSGQRDEAARPRQSRAQHARQQLRRVRGVAESCGSGVTVELAPGF